jgi:hypothetical protein
MYRSVFINILAIVGLAFLDVALVANLPWGLHRLHLLLLALVFVVLLSNIRLAAWWALGGGIILELFSFTWFGKYLSLIFISLLVAQILLDKVLTNRSIYSVIIMTGLITLLWDIGFLLFDYQTVVWSWLYLIKNLGLSLLYNIVAAGLIFYLLNTFSRRFQPVFLLSKK